MGPFIEISKVQPSTSFRPHHEESRKILALLMQGGRRGDFQLLLSLDNFLVRGDRLEVIDAGPLDYEVFL